VNKKTNIKEIVTIIFLFVSAINLNGQSDIDLLLEKSHSSRFSPKNSMDSLLSTFSQDSIISINEKEIFQDILSEVGLSNNLNELKGIKETVLKSEAVDISSKIKNLAKSVQKLSEIGQTKYGSTNFGINSYYNSQYSVNDSSISGGNLFPVGNQFTNINGQSNFQIFGIPLSGNITAVFNNNEFQSQWSNASIQFDFNQLKSNLQERLKKEVLNDFSFEGLKDNLKNKMVEKISPLKGKLTNIDDLRKVPTDLLRKKTEKLKEKLEEKKRDLLGNGYLNKADQAIVKNDIKFQLYNTIVSHPTFTSLKFKAEQKLDSLKSRISKKDSIINARIDSSVLMTQIDTIQKLVEKLRKFESKYEQMWQEKQVWINRIEELRTKVGNMEESLKNLENPAYLFSKVKESKYSGSISQLERFMYDTKDFAIGRVSVEEDEFTIRNQVLNGLKYEREREGRTMGLIYGTGAQYSFNSPIVYNPFQQVSLGKRFVFLKYGIQTSDSAKITIRMMNALRVNDTTLNTFGGSPNNTVLSAQYEKEVTKGKRGSLLLHVGAAYSELGNTILDTEDSIKFKDKIAITGTVYYQMNEKTRIGLGYYYTGSEFMTYGNEYLLNNRNGIKADFRIGLFSNALLLRGEWRNSILNKPSRLGLTESNISQVTGEMTAMLGKLGFIQVQYIPNTITQTEETYGRRLGYHSNIYMVTSALHYKISKAVQYTTITFSNMNQQVDYFDSLRINESEYIYLNHKYMLGDKQNLEFRGQIGLRNLFNDFSNNGALTSGFFQSTYNMRVGKGIKFTIGIQAIKKNYEQFWKEGIVTNFSKKWGKVLSINMNVIYRNKFLENANTILNPNGTLPQEWIINTSLGCQF
jgi:hypothetical protein